MKRLLQAILIILISATTCMAQPGRAMERIHAAKMAYITDRLHLTADQSANFVPLYNDYEHELRDMRRAFFKKCRGADPSEADDATSRQCIDDNLDYQQQVIDLKRRYNERFLKVISAQQLSDLYMAEREFRQILMKRLEQRRGGRGR